MTKKEFYIRVTKSKKDVLGEFLGILSKGKIPYCVIGGLAVNAYAEPVVTLDLDIVVANDRIGDLVSILRRGKFNTREFTHSINISSPYSNLRIQIQREDFFQGFLKKAVKRDVLGYEMYVAKIEDVMRSKIEAATKPQRQPVKRYKNHLDIMDIRRLIDTEPLLKKLLPSELAKKLYPKNSKVK